MKTVRRYRVELRTRTASNRLLACWRFLGMAYAVLRWGGVALKWEEEI